MSAVNKLLKKKHNQNAQQSQTPTSPRQSNNNNNINRLANNSNTTNSPIKGQSIGNSFSPPTYNQGLNPSNPNFQFQFDKKLQTQYEKWAQFSQANSYNTKFSHQYFPNSVTTYNKAKCPLACFTQPINSDFDQSRIMEERSATKLPRCNYCRSYMNCYNQLFQNKTCTYYKCFFCGKENTINVNEYNPYVQQNGQLSINQQYYELTDSNYRMLGAQNVYTTSPPQNVFIFMIDVSNSAFTSKMLYYVVTVAKDILSRQQYNQTVLYLFTYDDTVHQYDFTGKQVKCTILDGTINEPNVRFNQIIGDIRNKLFDLLDCLQQIAQKNQKTGSNFFSAFTYVYESIKHTAGKMFIFQANQSIASQPFTQQVVKDPKTLQTVKTSPPLRKSLLQTANKLFFNKFVANMLSTNISCSIFVFTKTFKNIRVFSDTCKLTNSELNIYYKDSPQDLNKFYYDLYYLLGANYYSDVKMEIIIIPGWYFTAVYGNLYRLKQFITFKLCHTQASKKICFGFMPQQNTQLAPPYFSFQIVTNFFSQRTHYMQVNTLVLPITNSAQKIYDTIDSQVVSAGILKTVMSTLRLEQNSIVRTKCLKMLGGIWNSANSFYKKNPPPQIRTIIMTILGFLKSSHSQTEVINNTPILDRVISQRNYLQCIGSLQLSTFFNPYLFKISNMTNDMCKDEQDFIYPQSVQLKFNDVKQGIYLMDTGLYLFLFIAKQCDPRLLVQLFGKQKFTKGQILYEQNINQQSPLGQKLTNLIRVLRQQKSYGWIPLIIVRCGEGSNNERNFYMNFYAEKYDQFKTFKFNEKEFTMMLQQQYS